MLNKNKINAYPLFISHHIFLTKEQRYDIYEGSKVHTFGSIIETTNLNNKKEFFPHEIFVDYVLDTEPSSNVVEIRKDKYHVHLPIKFIHGDMDLENLNTDDYFYSEDLLDIDDGGRQEIYFKWKRIYTDENKKIVTLHNFNLRDIEVFKTSYSFI